MTTAPAAAPTFGGIEVRSIDYVPLSERHASSGTLVRCGS